MLGAINNGWPQAGTAFASQSRVSSPAPSDFPDIAVSTDTDPTTQASVNGGQGDDRATTAAATSASADVDILAQLAKGLGNTTHASFGVETIDHSGHVLAGASFDASGNLSVFGSGSADGATSDVSMALSAGNFGDTWATQTSAELARASYELTSLLGQPDAKASNPGIDQVA